MANESEEEILLTVTVDEAAAEKSVLQLKKQLDFLKATARDLQKDLDSGAITNKQYGESMGRINAQSKVLTTELTKQEKALSDNQRTMALAAGSINAMKANIAKMSEEWSSLSKAERQNDEVGGALLEKIHALSKAHDEEAKKLTTSRKGVVDYIKDMNVLGINVGQAIETFKAGGDGVGVFTKSMLTARGAAIAFTAVPIIAVLAAVIAFFKSTDEGADKLEQGIAGLTEGFRYLMKGIAPVGKLLVDLFTSPIDTIKKLVDGTHEYAVSLRGVASAAIQAGQAQAAYTKTMQDLEDLEDNLIAQREKVGLQVDQALLKVKDRSLTEKQKIAILRDAGKAEASLAGETIKNAKIAYDAVVKLNKDKQKALKLSDDERRDQIKAELTAEADLIKAKRESLNTQQAIRNRETAQIEEEASSRKAANEKAKQAAKDAAQDRVYEAELAILTLKKRGEDSIEIEAELIKRQVALIQKRGELEKSGLAKNAVQRKLIEAKVNSEILELAAQSAIKLANQTFSIQENRLNAQLALTTKGSEKELELQRKLINDKLAFDKSNAVDTIKDKAQLVAKLRLLDAQANAATESLEDAFGKGEIERASELNQKRLQAEIDLGAQTFAAQQASQQKQIELEEKHALDLLNLEEKTTKERGLLDEKLSSDILVRRNAIQAKRIAAEKQLEAEAVARAKADAVALAEARLAGTAEGSRKELDARKDLLKKQYDAEIANVKLTEAEKAKIKAQYDANRKKLDEDFAKQQVQQIIDTVALATATLSTSYEAQTQALLTNLDKQQAAALKSAGANADLRARIEEQYSKKREKIEKEAAEKRRKIASIENLIATAQAGTAALTLFAKNPILGAITEALILAKALKSQQLIDSQAFADGGVYRSDGRGGYIRGAGTTKSDSINSKLSDRESVINARSTEMFYNQLSAMNVAGGGKPFPGAGGEPVPQLTNFNMGGVMNTGNDTDLVAAVIAGMKAANITIAVTDYKKAEADYTYAQASGNS